MGDRFEQLKRALSDKGLRYTKQREIIISEFLKAGSHISATELYKRVSKKNKNIGFATVYRTLKVLTQCGIAEGKSFGDGQSRFEPATEHDHHDHFVCEICGKIIEFYSQQLEDIQIEISKRYDFTVKRHDLQIYGVCKDCKNKK